MIIDAEILIWVISGTTAGTWIILGVLYRMISSTADDVKDIDRRLCRIEGALSNKECCALKHNHDSKKEAL